MYSVVHATPFDAIVLFAECAVAISQCVLDK